MPDFLRYQFESEWPEDTEIPWWNAGRSQLNKVIRLYNAWQIEGFSVDRATRILARIEQGINTFASQDGGDAWRGALKRMKEFVERMVRV